MSSSAVRGAVLVTLAAILGFLILRGAADQEQVPLTTVPAPVQATATPEVEPTSGAVNLAEPTAIAAEARPASQVRVLVANGTDVGGAALRLTETLRNQGFNAREPKNAEPKVASVIYYRPSFAPEAVVVRDLLGQNTPIQPMPEPDPVVGEGIDLVPVDVFVLVGADGLAGGAS